MLFKITEIQIETRDYVSTQCIPGRDMVEATYRVLWLIQIYLYPQLIIFGILENDLDFFPKNCIILTAKKFIFDSAKNSKVLNLNRFRAYFKGIFSDQEYIAKINCNTEKFQASWSVFHRLKNI